jgi:hypothetical protein
MAAAVLDIPDEGLPGEFWIADGPRERGRLFWDDRGRPSITTNGVIREWHTLRETIGPHYYTVDAILGPREIVADSIPVSVLGTLDSGQAITLRDSMLLGATLPTPQTHLGIGLLIGTHAPSKDALFTSARFSVPHARRWYSIFSSKEPVDLIIGETPATLSVDLTEDDAWIQLAVEGGLPSHEWERRFWHRCSIMMSLWVNDEVRPRRIQLRLPGTEAWIAQVWRRNQGDSSFDWPTSLLTPQDLTLQHIAKALSAFEAWGTVAEIASRDAGDGTKLQTSVFLYASSLEGFHHHVDQPRRKPFPGLTGSQAKKVARAAAEAAVSKALDLKADIGDRDEAISRIFSHFQFFNQLSFYEQLQELVPNIQRVTPGLIGQDEKAWIEWVVAARNQEAHRRPRRKQAPEDKPVRLLEETEHLYQLRGSTQWALRVRILLELGVDGDTLRRRLARHQRFLLVLANMDRSEPSWPGSRLDDFVAATGDEDAAE